MYRCALPTFLASALLWGAYATASRAQWVGPPVRSDLSGRYVNQSNGAECSIFRQGRTFVFINEGGTRARFRYVGPRRLEMVAGDWDPRTVATVEGLNPEGRMVIRFDSTGSPGYWVRQ